MWGQHDSEPLNGGYPTHQWFVGEIILDRHCLQVDPNAPPGVYQIEIGMYILETMERLAVRDADGRPVGDRILLSKIRVVAEGEK